MARIEAAGYSIWSPDQTTTIGGWHVARNGGFTRRLNSASAREPADTDASTIDEIERWIVDGGGGHLAVRVTPLSDDATMAAAARGSSLVPVDPTLVLAKEIDPSPEVATDVRLTAPDEPAYIRDLVALNGRDPAHVPQWRRIVERLEVGIGLWVPEVAVGFVGIDDAVACVYSIAVDRRVRGLGWGTALMATAESWAGGMRATHITLQVVETNAPAIALYERLGFERAYVYHYLERAPRSRME